MSRRRMRWSASPKRRGKPATYKIHRPIEEERIAEQHRQEQSTEQAIKVRQGTDVHANWSAQERGEHGKFSDRKSTRLNSSHANISYAFFCLKKNTSFFDPFVPGLHLPC